MTRAPATFLDLELLDAEKATLELLYSEACDDERPPLAARIGELDEQIDDLRQELAER